MSAPTPGGTKWTPVGDRRRKVVIQQQSTGTRTGMGFLPGTWSTVLTTWAKVTVRAMSTFASPGAVQEPITKAVYILNIRYAPSTPILNGMRVTDGTAYYLIQNVQDVDERHRELNLYCSQIPAPMAENQ